jgi:hypothetical protein
MNDDISIRRYDMIRSKTSLRSGVTLAMLSCLLFGGMWFPFPAQAEILSISVDPVEPTSTDPIIVHVQGEFPDGCWSVEEIQCATVIGNSLNIEVFATDSWLPGGFCLTVIVPYSEDCFLEPLLPGRYTVNVTEHHESLRDASPNLMSFEFDVTESSGSTLQLDIKPGSCPNPLNVKVFEKPPKNDKSQKGGVLPVAILGTADLEIQDIDISSLFLEGVAPLRYGFEDVAAPVRDGVECECTGEGPDGHMDLTLKFRKSEIVSALGAVSDGDKIALTLTGQMADGTTFEASDCVKILGVKSEIQRPENDEVVLGHAAPNPFNPSTRIRYYLPGREYVRLSIFDVNGRRIAQLVAKVQSAGEQLAEWDAIGMPSGIYFYRLEAGDFSEAKKMILLK